MNIHAISKVKAARDRIASLPVNQHNLSESEKQAIRASLAHLDQHKDRMAKQLRQALTKYGV